MLDDRLLAAVRGHVTQVETFHDLDIGHLDAVTTVSAAFDGCRVGLGVAEAADGEIVAVDGVVWRIPSDGIPVKAPADLGLPFAVAASGGSSINVPLSAGADMASLTSTIDEIRAMVRAAGAPVVALRLDGTFVEVLLRSEPRQEPPFQDLSHVLEHEVRFAFEEWSGTLVGFRFPDVRDDIAIPGLHLHAISSDRRSGGHCHHATVKQATLTAWIDDVTFVVP
jgi:acetolactate decarboxylase